MPANLTPQYKKAEEEYRRAQAPDEELRCLELMLREIPKHKGTDKLQAELKAKISKARQETERAKKAGNNGYHGPHIQRQGAGRAIILGGSNAGKSQLLAKLTRATPEGAPYPFTTREPPPRMMPWDASLVHLIATPPITAEHSTGLDELCSAIYEALAVVRVYTKLPTKKEADFERRFTLKRGGTLLEVAELVHRDLAVSFKYARVWGTAVFAPGTQMKG